MLPLQGAFPHPDQPDRLSSFPINYKNPYDQPGQAYTPSTRYMSAYQPSADVSERTSLLTQADATLSIDRQLSSGWYACYKYWLYFLAFPSIIIFLKNVQSLSASPYMILKVIRCLFEVAYAVVMTDVLKKKKVEKAGLGFKLAIADSVILALQIGAGVLETIGNQNPEADSDNTDGDFLHLGVFICTSVIFCLYCSFGIVIPAWKIKGLIEKRETILQNDVDLYDF